MNIDDKNQNKVYYQKRDLGIGGMDWGKRWLPISQQERV